MNTRSVQRTLLASAGFKALPVGVLTDVQDPGMRIGSEFQAMIPEYDSGSDTIGPGSLLLWKPSEMITDSELENYLRLAKDRYGYTPDQSLGMLYYHSYDIAKAVNDLANFCPLKEDWSIEDKVIFEQAFRYHSKNFHRIKLMLPDKPISSLVKYYYLWKRSHAQYSLMDKQAMKNSKRMSNGLPPTNDDTDSIHSGSNRSLGDTPPHITPVQLVGKGKQLPTGIYMSAAELSMLSSSGTDYIQDIDAELSTLKVEIQTGKQELTDLRTSISDMEDLIEGLRPAIVSHKTTAVPTKWTDEEIKIALEVISKTGKDVEGLARALPAKTIPQCRNFFTNYKRKLNLPRLIAEYEIRNGQKLSRYSRQAVEHMGSESFTDNLFTNANSSTLGMHHISQDHGNEDSSKKPRIMDYSII